MFDRHVPYLCTFATTTTTCVISQQFQVFPLINDPYSQVPFIDPFWSIKSPRIHLECPAVFEWKMHS